jgi:ATP-dependent helicase Lhr and Lhr-like helicase
MIPAKHDDPLELFLPPVSEWFRAHMGTPTPVQRQGWPVIAAGANALLLAPTGSGKTLAAFLACLDGLWRQSPIRPGVQVLYISPLKALNNDIYRNLQIPLQGIAAGDPALPRIDIAVRTGDTPAVERQRLLRKPPHVLITTPESLHLLLTSKARETLRNVTHCIVDEIHALCPNKRGVFLALLLERLQALIGHDFVRIGLSATQRPLEEVARYLGGFSYDASGQWRQRPVTIVDAGLRKNLDLQVVSPVEHFGPLPEKSIWPAIYRRLTEEIRRHRSTIIFANNRRSVERLTAMLNECLSESADAVVDGQEILVRAHHGSVSLEVRQQTEQALKEGRLRAVVATASLELGIDMGAVDLVIQVESPGNVARALQRVGRAGHLVGQSSKGRLFPKTLPDLLNQAVLAAEMAAGHVEALRVPMNCLDVLAQQVIAMTAMEDWRVSDLYTLVRQAYPYRDLTPAAFDAVLEMVTGRYRFSNPPLDARERDPREGEAPAEPPRLLPAQQLTALQPRISWDRVHQRLQALPGSQRLALVHGGTIPDTGQYAVYTMKGLRIGEVDEEFVYERRIGDTFLLGTSAWRIDRIETDRVVVYPAEGMPAMAPFWRGESVGRTYDLGLAQGAFLRIVSERLDQPDCLDWLQRDYFLDGASARNLRAFVQRQKMRTSGVPTDRVLMIEASRDPLGDWQVVLLCPLGRSLNLSLRLALEHRLQARLGYRPQCLHHDDGILIRLTESDEPVVDLFDGIAPDNVRDMILEELADSALFALRFRQNAARALMMPRGAAGKRAPLWLQRLRGRDLLQVARRHPDFPIIAETFRECLHDHLDLPHLQQLLGDIAAGKVQVETRRLDSPSPFAAGLLFAFTAAFMYQYDDVEADSERGSAPLDQALLDQLIGHDGRPLPLDPRAIQQVDRRLRGVGQPPRTKPEAAEWLRRLGDVSSQELEGPLLGFLLELQEEQVVTQITLPNAQEPARWILAEDAELYHTAFAADAEQAQESAAIILQRFLDTHALIGLDDVLQRYAFERGWAERQLAEWTRKGRLVRVVAAETEPMQWSAPDNFEQMQRSTLSILRREVMTCPAAQFADFVTRWQQLHPATQVNGADGLRDVLHRLQASPMPIELWEHAILPTRSKGYVPRQLDELIGAGQWLWYCRRDSEGGAESLAFVEREALPELLPPANETAELDAASSTIMEVLRGRGALFTSDLAAQANLSVATVRAALWSLLRLGIVTNDQYDLLRHGEPPRDDQPPPMRSRGEVRAFLRDSRRRQENVRPEGRWSLIPWGQPDPEAAAFFQARLLLERYGVVARELAILSGSSTPWRILYEIMSRLELAGEVRRGYFVEGLSGAQFALPEAARKLNEIAAPSNASAPALLLHSLDPANLYGSGAAFELPQAFHRRAGNWLVLKAGRPTLIIEQHGKRLTPLPSASSDDLAQAVARLPDLLKTREVRHKLTVESWNDQPITTTVGKELLEQVGFVRDYQAMTLYTDVRA